MIAVKKVSWILPRLRGWAALCTFLLAPMIYASAQQVEGQLQDPDPKVRERAAKELGEQGNPAYVPFLASAVQDPEEKVRLAVVKSLIRLDTEASLEPLCQAVRDGIPEIRFLAIDGIVNFYLPGYVDTGFGGFFRSVTGAVEGLFSDVDIVVADPDIDLHEVVLRTLRQSLTGAPDMRTRARAAHALGVLHAEQTIPDLIQALYFNNVELTEEILRAFQKIKDTSVGPRILFLLDFPQKEIQQLAATTLGLLRAESAIPNLRQLFENSRHKNVRRAALEALAFMPQEQTALLFVQHLDDREKELRIAASLGLGRLKEQNYLGALAQRRQEERDSGVRLALAFGLVAKGQMDYLQELVSNLSSRVRQGEARPYLIELAREAAVREALRPHLYSPDADIRKNLCRVYAASGDSTSISYLEVLLRDRDAEVVQEASRAIRILRSRGF